ncbi:MAG: BBP7 family outer membrane beta-barrel protein [Pirellulaceae bacterium]|nr:BBP7 family outer membrane beta-barrel protein [Pirellulaceae bacterium]
MKLSPYALACAIACSCGLMLPGSVSAEAPRTFDRALAAYDYEAQVQPASPSDQPIAPPPLMADNFACGSEQADCDCDDGCDPTWTFRLGTVIMKRSNPNAFPIFTDGFGGPTLVDAADYRFDYRAGIDFGAIRDIDDDLAFDFRYFAIDSWTATQTNPLAVGGTVLNIATPVIFFGFDPANSTYGSNLYSTEFNLRRKHECVTTFIGYRYVELNEDLDFQLINISNARYSESADNRMHGVQFGAEADLWNNGNRLSVEGWLKAGVYYDLIRHRSQIEFPPGTPIFTPLNQRDNNTAFLGEIGLVGVYQLTDAIAIRGGYQLLWLDGVALASEQVPTTNVTIGTGADLHGDVFFHGALVGVEARW